MSYEESKKKNEKGSFLHRKHDSAQEFVCDRCMDPKVSKTKVIWETKNDNKKVICNGCYGNILSRVE